MKKIIITFVLLVLVLGGVYCAINTGKDINFQSDSYGAWEQVKQVNLGDEIKIKDKTFTIEKLEKISDTRYNIVLGKGSYDDFCEVFYFDGGKNYTIQQQPSWNFHVEKNKKKEATSIYINLNFKDTHFISTKNEDITINDLEQIYLTPINNRSMDEYYTVNLK